MVVGERKKYCIQNVIISHIFTIFMYPFLFVDGIELAKLNSFFGSYATYILIILIKFQTVYSNFKGLVGVFFYDHASKWGNLFFLFFFLLLLARHQLKLHFTTIIKKEKSPNNKKDICKLFTSIKKSFLLKKVYVYQT